MGGENRLWGEGSKFEHAPLGDRWGNRPHSVSVRIREREDSMTTPYSDLGMLIGNIAGDLSHVADSEADIETDTTLCGDVTSVTISAPGYTVTVTPTPTTTSTPPPYLGMRHPPM